MAIEFIKSDKNLNFLTAIVSADPSQGMIDTVRASRSGLEALEMPYEVICITDGSDQDVVDGLRELGRDWPNLVVLGQRPWAGDDVALAVALRRAKGNIVLTMAGWPEVAPEDLVKLKDALDGAEMVSAIRGDRPDGALHSWRHRRFAGLLSRLFGQSPSDPFCRTRIARKAVLEDVAGFGVRQHFIPVIAGQRGYKLAEIELRGASDTRGTAAKYFFRPSGHVSAFFDAVSLYVVLKFLRRPLRFFGAIGLPLLILGAIAMSVLLIQRLTGEALADRPALIIAVLMMVLGVQIFAIGLIGEIIIFSKSRRMKQYAVKDIITQNEPANMAQDAPRFVAPGQVME